jgi:hypothetical protein
LLIVELTPAQAGVFVGPETSSETLALQPIVEGACPYQTAQSFSDTRFRLWISNWDAPSMQKLSCEIEAITDLESAKRAAILLLQQIGIQRQMMDVLIRNDWYDSDAL